MTERTRTRASDASGPLHATRGCPARDARYGARRRVRNSQRSCSRQIALAALSTGRAGTRQMRDGSQMMGGAVTKRAIAAGSRVALIRYVLASLIAALCVTTATALPVTYTEIAT